jgi:hypothetical protein
MRDEWGYVVKVKIARTKRKATYAGWGTGVAFFGEERLMCRAWARTRDFASTMPDEEPTFVD